MIIDIDSIYHFTITFSSSNNVKKNVGRSLDGKMEQFV